MIMKSLVVLLVPMMALSATDPRDLFREAVSNFKKDQVAAMRFTHLETDETKGQGVEVSLITPIEGAPYEKVISRNGELLTGQALHREEAKYQKAVVERSSESPRQREERVRKYKEMAKILDEAPDAFDFKMLPDESLDGRSNYVVELTPKPGYKPRNMKLKMFVGLKAKVWIDKEDLRIAKADATVIDTIALGWVMARIQKGSHLGLEQQPLSDGTWVPRRYLIDGSVRICLIADKQLVEKVTFSSYTPVSQPATTEVAEREGK
jgi:hypothetical protein